MIVVVQDALAVPAGFALLTEGALPILLGVDVVVDPVVTKPPVTTTRPRFGGRGGAVPLHWWGPAPAGEVPTAQDEARRARTLVAAIGVAMEDGDEADRLAATIGLALDKKPRG